MYLFFIIYYRFLLLFMNNECFKLYFFVWFFLMGYIDYCMICILRDRSSNWAGVKTMIQGRRVKYESSNWLLN